MSSGDGDASGAAGRSAGKEKMPNIPKTEPSSPKKASAEKPAKGAKTPASKKASAEKPGKPKAIAKAAKGAAKRDAENRKRQVVRAKERALEDKARRLDALQDALGAMLAKTSDDDPEGDAISSLFHSVCDRHRRAAAELDEYRKRKEPAGTGSVRLT